MSSDILSSNDGEYGEEFDETPGTTQRKQRKRPEEPRQLIRWDSKSQKLQHRRLLSTFID